MKVAMVACCDPDGCMISATLIFAKIKSKKRRWHGQAPRMRYHGLLIVSRFSCTAGCWRARVLPEGRGRAAQPGPHQLRAAVRLQPWLLARAHAFLHAPGKAASMRAIDQTNDMLLLSVRIRPSSSAKCGRLAAFDDQNSSRLQLPVPSAFRCCACCLCCSVPPVEFDKPNSSRR